MSAKNGWPRLYRLPDSGWLFGVCAGLADFYGWRLRTVRFLAVLAILFAGWPFLFAYICGVFLLPTQDELAAKQARRATIKPPSTDDAMPYRGRLRERYQHIERRMRKVEAYLHSNEYQLRSAFKDLEGVAE